MAWNRKSLFIGAHFWFVPSGSAFTSPSAGNVAQNGIWPDETEAGWTGWAMGICEEYSIDPKYASAETILAPSPGQIKAVKKIIPYSVPEIEFTLLQADTYAPQLALNTEALTGLATAHVNGGGAPGVEGIIKVQKYDQDNNLIMNIENWAFLELKSPMKGSPKSMTKPQFMATLLDSVNNLIEL